MRARRACARDDREEPVRGRSTAGSQPSPRTATESGRENRAAGGLSERDAIAVRARIVPDDPNAHQHLADRLTAGGREHQEIRDAHSGEKHGHRQERRSTEVGRRRVRDLQCRPENEGADAAEEQPVECGRAQAVRHCDIRAGFESSARNVRRSAAMERRYHRARWNAYAYRFFPLEALQILEQIIVERTRTTLDPRCRARCRHWTPNGQRARRRWKRTGGAAIVAGNVHLHRTPPPRPRLPSSATSPAKAPSSCGPMVLTNSGNSVVGGRWLAGARGAGCGSAATPAMQAPAPALAQSADGSMARLARRAAAGADA